MAKNPERAVEKAVRGMLPKNTLGRQMLSKLKVYRARTTRIRRSSRCLTRSRRSPKSTPAAPRPQAPAK